MESRLINTILEAIIIKSTSILDYLSKLVFEVENMPKALLHILKENQLTIIMVKLSWIKLNRVYG